MIVNSWNFVLCAALAALAFCVGSSASAQDSATKAQETGENSPEFDRDVRRILADQCYQCHGPDESKREADLRLDLRDAAMADLGGYRAIVPGDPDNSELLRRVFSDDPDEQMPPPESKLVLSDAEKGILLNWIESGAEWTGHWAFQKPVKIQPPEVQDRHWPSGDIDRFILSRLEAAHLKPSQPADRERLLRRVTVDLTGLPPTIEQIDSFLGDDSAEAYDRVVDRLLESEACAERLALDWMDLARYADSHGMHADGWRRMWPWRDWVIDAFAKNMSYDKFVTWQLAGDLMEQPTRGQILATAFHRNHPMTAEGGVIDEEFRQYYVFDRVETTATAFMGLTMQCARCHDHKFDPIGQKEYYQLAAFYNNVHELGMTGDDGNFGPLLALPTEDVEQELATLDAEIAKLESQIRALKRDARTQFDELKQAPTADLPLPAGQRFALNTLEQPSVDSPKEEQQDPKDQEEDEGDKEDPKSEPDVLDGNTAVTANIAPQLIDAIDGRGVLIDDEYGYLSIKSAGLFDLADRFTASVWLRPDQPMDELTPNNLRTIFGNSGHKNQLWRGWDFDLDDQNRIVARVIHIYPDELIDVRSKVAIQVSRWTHVAFTYDGSGGASGIRLYIDGERVEAVVHQDQLTKTIYPAQHAIDFPRDTEREIRVGRSYRAFGGEFGILLGAFDDIRFFGTALTELEMNSLYASYETQPGVAEAKSGGSADAGESETDRAFEHWWTREHVGHRDLLDKLKIARGTSIQLRSSIPEVMVMSEMDYPRKTHVLLRGEYTQSGDQVQPGTPSAILSFPKELPPNRLGLAKWLFDENNGLTARVAANHYWQLIFGNGLVRTPHDFGVQGERPTHPELLDFLAVSLRQSNWNLRELIRKMVLSSTYRQSAVVRPDLSEKDPGNRLLGRSPSYRLPAEAIRDLALSASGLLVTKIGGPSVRPYQPDGLWIEKNNFSQYLLNYKADEGDKLYRRSMYTFIRRTSPPPAMIAMDAPNRSVCTVKREVTNTPLQALVMLNDPQFVEASRVLAERIQKQDLQTLSEKIEFAFRLLTARRPTDRELSVLDSIYRQQFERYTTDRDSADALLAVGASEPDSSLDSVETAALTMVTSTIMNFDESYMKR